MKKLLIVLTALASAALVPISSAQAYCAGETRLISRCGSCGVPVYQRWQAVGYDCHGCPIYRWATLTHRCVSHHSSHHHHKSHHRSHHSRKHHHR